MNVLGTHGTSGDAAWKIQSFWPKEIDHWALYDIEKDHNEMHDLSEL